MKSKLYFLMLCAFSGVLLGAAFGPQRIRWTWHDMTLYGGTFYSSTNLDSVEFGLRDDGVVVWREITTKTNAVIVRTNSPAERDEVPSGTIILTNSIPFRFDMTNYFNDDLIPHIYFSPTGILYRP